MSAYASVIASMESELEELDRAYEQHRPKLVAALDALRVLAGVAADPPAADTAARRGPAPAATPARIQPGSGFSFNPPDLQADIVAALRKHGGTMTPKELQAAIGRDKVTTARHLAPLLAKGLVTKSGVRRGVKLALVQKAIAPAPRADADLEKVWDGTKGSPSLTGSADGLGSSLSGVSYEVGRRGR